MFDSGRKNEPLTTEERWISGVFLVIIFGLFIAEIVHDYQPVKLSALLVVLFWIPLLAVHEAGHAVVATLLGWHVGQIVIGAGRLLGAFRIGSAFVEIRVVLVEGFIKCVPTNLRWPRLKSALIYFAGPGVELLLALIVLWLVGPDRLFSRSDDYTLIIWQSLAVASAAQGLLNLVPHAVQTKTGDIANDGLGIIRSFLKPTSYYAAMIGRTFNEEQSEWEDYDPGDWWKHQQ